MQKRGAAPPPPAGAGPPRRLAAGPPGLPPAAAHLSAPSALGSRRLRAAPTCRPGRVPGLRGGESRDPAAGGGCCPGPGPGVGSRSGAFSLFRCLKLAPAERCGHVTGVANRRRPCFRDPPSRLGGRCGPARQVRLLGRRERPVRWPRRAVRSAERRRVRQVSWGVGTAGEAAAGEAEPRGAGARLLGRALEGSAAAGRGDTGYHGQAPQPSGP